jgi:hypothetical protein
MTSARAITEQASNGQIGQPAATMMENKKSSVPVDCKCAGIIYRAGTGLEAVFAVGEGAQFLWITLWLTCCATCSDPHAQRLPLDRSYFEQRFSQ